MSENVKTFKIVEFVEEKIHNKRSVDIVCASHIRYDPLRDCLLAKFMAPPYEDSYIIKGNLPAPESWGSFKIAILGEAGKNSLYINFFYSYLIDVGICICVVHCHT